MAFSQELVPLESVRKLKAKEFRNFWDPDDNIFILTFSNFGRSAHTDFLETFKAALETLDMPKSEFGVISQFTTKVGLQRVLISMYYL